MKYIKTYKSHKSHEVINEEFVGKLVKGALGKLFQTFSTPFKDLVDDIKKSFKEGDPNSIKGIVMSNLNQAIDSAQKGLRDKNIANVSDVIGIMEKFKTILTQLAEGIGKDFGSAIGDKGKASAASEVAKSILIGSKEAGWKGIYGLLADPNYKFGSTKYTEAINNAVKGKDDAQQLKIAQDTSFKFFDSFQKDMLTQLDKELTEEEMKKIYDDAIGKGGGQIATMNYEKLKELFDKKVKVMYKMNGFDNGKNPEEQKDRIGIKTIDTLDDQGNVGFKSEDGTDFKKKYEDILGAAPQDQDKTAAEITNNLKNIKNDKDKLKAVKNYTDFLQNAQKDKIAEVDALIRPEGEKTPTPEQNQQ